MNSSTRNTKLAASPKPSTAVSEDVETRANHLAGAREAQEAVEGLRKLARQKTGGEGFAIKGTMMDLVTDSPNSTEIPALVPPMPQEEFDRLTLKEKADFLGRQMQANIARYAGRPELLIAENPHRDFSRFEKQAPMKADDLDDERDIFGDLDGDGKMKPTACLGPRLRTNPAVVAWLLERMRQRDLAERPTGV